MFTATPLGSSRVLMGLEMVEERRTERNVRPTQGGVRREESEEKWSAKEENNGKLSSSW